MGKMEYPFGVAPMSGVELIAEKPWLKLKAPIVPWMWEPSYADQHWQRRGEFNPQKRGEWAASVINPARQGLSMASVSSEVPSFLTQDPWPAHQSYSANFPFLMDRELALFVQELGGGSKHVELLEWDFPEGSSEPFVSRPTRVNVMNIVTHAVHPFSFSAFLESEVPGILPEHISMAISDLSYFLFEKIYCLDIWRMMGDMNYLYVSPRGRIKLQNFRQTLQFKSRSVAFPDGSGYSALMAPNWPPIPLRIPTADYRKLRLRNVMPTEDVQIGWKIHPLNPSSISHSKFKAYARDNNLQIEEM